MVVAIAAKLNNEKIGTKLKPPYTCLYEKKNIRNLQSTRSIESNKSKVNKVEITKNLLHCKNQLRSLKEAYNKTKEKNKQTGNSPEFRTYTEFEEVLRYRDFMKIPEFQQVGIDNGEYETNRIVQSPTFNEEREDREVKKNVKIMVLILFYLQIFMCAPFFM